MRILLMTLCFYIYGMSESIESVLQKSNKSSFNFQDIKNSAISISNKTLDDVLFVHLSKKAPNLYKKIVLFNENEKQKNISKDALYLLASNSVSENSIREFIIEGSFLNYNFGTRLAVILQGPFKKEFQNKVKSIIKELEGYESAKYFINNFKISIDPAIFKKLNIKKVPAIAYSTHSGNSYPSRSNVKFLIRGDVGVKEFFYLIQKEDSNFENYYNSIITAQ